MREFRLDLSVGLSTTDEDCKILFLKSEEGVHFPFTVMNEELEELFIAAEEGKGAIPPTIEGAIQELKEEGAKVTSILVVGVDEEDNLLVYGVVENNGVKVMKSCDILAAVMLAIHFETPIFIADDVILAMSESEFNKSVVEAMDTPDEE